MDDQELATLTHARQKVVAELLLDPDVLRRYFDLHKEVIKREVGAATGTHSTCTAFCLYYLSTAGLIAAEGTLVPFAPLFPGEVRRLLEALGSAIVGGNNNTQQEQVTDIGPLPNQYNSSILTAGLLKATRLLGLPVDAQILTVCTGVVDWLVKLVLEHNGYVPTIGHTTIPSPYLTFWTGAAIHEWAEGGAVAQEAEGVIQAKEALARIGVWAERELAYLVAFHTSGLHSRFDVIELVYSALAAVRFRGGTDTIELARKGVAIVLENHFKDGCFASSAPVLADRVRNFSLQCPTAEALALLLIANPRLFVGHWQSLYACYTWLNLRRQPNGWYPESEGRHGQPNAFMTASTVALLSALASFLDDTLHSESCERFGVLPFTPDPKLASFQYPEELQEILQDNVVIPLTARPRQDKLAAFSMILYGPPGTSKTTIARKLAQDLRWPILVINQSAFLRNGLNNIDSEADHIFQLIYNLKEVVVLFDEVEELVQDRNAPDKPSRLLTTSMLPRISYLRDLRRAVFIFGTNRLESIDESISRLGRFDIIHCVMPPTEGYRRKILEGLLDVYTVTDDVRRAFGERNVLARTDSFCYPDLDALVRRVTLEDQSGRKALATIIDGAIEVGRKTVEASKGRFERFLTNKRMFDRP